MCAKMHQAGRLRHKHISRVYKQWRERRATFRYVIINLLLPLLWVFPSPVQHSHEITLPVETLAPVPSLPIALLRNSFLFSVGVRVEIYDLPFSPSYSRQGGGHVSSLVR